MFVIDLCKHNICLFYVGQFSTQLLIVIADIIEPSEGCLYKIKSVYDYKINKNV